MQWNEMKSKKKLQTSERIKNEKKNVFFISQLQCVSAWCPDKKISKPKKELPAKERREKKESYLVSVCWGN